MLKARRQVLGNHEKSLSKSLETINVKMMFVTPPPVDI